MNTAIDVLGWTGFGIGGFTHDDLPSGGVGWVGIGVHQTSVALCRYPWPGQKTDVG